MNATPEAEEILGPERSLNEAEWERHWVESEDGLQLALYRQRDWQAGRPLLLFAHANGFNAGCYEPFLRRLGERANLFAIDLRGHGASDRPDEARLEAFRAPALASDTARHIARIRQLIGEGPLHMVAHSQGGIGAIVWASAQGQKGEDSFASMTLFEPPIHAPRGHPVWQQTQDRIVNWDRWARRRPSHYDSLADFEAAYDKVYTYRTFVAEMRRSHLRSLISRNPAGGYDLRCPGGIEASFYVQNEHYPVHEEVRHVTAPGVIFTADPGSGGDSHWSDMFFQLTEQSPGLDARVMTGRAHLMVQEDPDRCAGEVWKRIFAEG